MPRASQVDPCMLCAQLPCACSSNKAKKSQRPRMPPTPKPGEKKEEALPARSSAADRMRARAAAPEVQVDVAVTVRAAPKVKPLPELAPAEAAFLPAIRLLHEAFQIHPDDIRPWLPYLAEPASTRERAAVWRARKGDGDV